MQGLPPPLHPAKTQGALPHFFLKEASQEKGAAPPQHCQKGASLFSTSRTILHAARNGHISMSRQRALACTSPERAAR